MEDPRNQSGQANSIFKTWWFPKNALIFIPSDAPLGYKMIPLEGLQDMVHMIRNYSNIMYNHPNTQFRDMWKRDWDEFELLVQIQINMAQPDEEEL